MRAALCAASALVLLSCDRTPETAVGTALLIRVEVDAAISPTQLRFTIEAEGALVFGPKARPDPAGAALSGEQSLRVLLPDSRADQVLKVHVEAMAGGEILGTGEGTATIVRGREVTASFAVSRKIPDAGNPCANTQCMAGQRCVLGACVCDSTSCLDGCCAGTVCHPRSLLACGTGASACVTCDSAKSGACGVTGFCQCGAGAPCATGQRCVDGSCRCDATSCPGGCCVGQTCSAMSLSSCGAAGGACAACNIERSDSCTGGSCGCGPLGACAGGQRCVAGLCVCDATSCPTGCCSGNTCSPRALASCGAGGDSCVTCDPTKANLCSATGQCRCGTSPACGLGQNCIGGVCTGGACDAVSCPTGCCNGALCTTSSLATCGSGGSSCLACNPVTADSCATGGNCQCGSNPSCATGQRCLAGACVCDPTSCATGCCAGNVCTTQSLGTCGAPGGACQACEPSASDLCVAGKCQCGSEPSCGAGTRCIGGVCVCDATTCASGCCAGNVCNNAPSLAMCGAGGSSCAMCDSNTADSCAQGTCKCGASPACAAGQQCVSGSCVAPACTAATCPNGCCVNNVCTTPSATACGTGGAACASCDPAVGDTCSAAGTCGCGGAAACSGNQKCNGGVCVACDAASCPSGCCQGGQCTVSTQQACGIGGAACLACDFRSNSCVAGNCECSGNNPCPAGQECTPTGNCVAIVCNALTCPSGCCSGGCKTPSFTQCGTGSSACVTCNPTRADNCSSEGVCRCGMNPPCGGANCVGGACTGGACNATTCPNGCCMGGTCVTPSLSACGVGGSACVGCNMNRSDQCAPDGFCRCGAGLQCPNGKACSAGTCS